MAKNIKTNVEKSDVGIPPSSLSCSPHLQDFYSMIFSYTISDSQIGRTAFSKAIDIKYLSEHYVCLSSLKYTVSAYNIGNGKLYRHFGALQNQAKKEKSIYSIGDYRDLRISVLISLLGMHKTHSQHSLAEVYAASSSEEEDVLNAIYKNDNWDIAKKSVYFKVLLQELIVISSIYDTDRIGKYPHFCEVVLYHYLRYIDPDAANTIFVIPDKKGFGSYLYRSDLVSLQFICDVPSYLHIVNKFNQKALFFRGHSDTNYYLVPSLFRNPNHRKKEPEMCEELRRLSPQSFQGMDTQLDRLVEMQHYELPTRLLDISSNALIALLFTCDDTDQDGNDGEVVVLDCHEKYKYGVSDTIAMLSLLSKLNSDEERILFCLAKAFDILINEASKESDKASKKRQICLDSDNAIIHISNQFIQFFSGDCAIYARNAQAAVRTALNEARKGEPRKFTVLAMHKKFNNTEVVRRFVSQIKLEKLYFEPDIRPSDLLDVFFVKPTMLNNRIVKQSGAFVLCGQMSDDILEIAQLLNSYRYRNEDGLDENGDPVDNRVPIIIIPKDAKEDIREELKLCDLHRAAIYPEIDKVAKYIQNQYA